ncbi:MAG: GNAT family N-acetyltransferase [Gemmatimonadales bacterium]|nr:GNAT family N-acetyltransferase [Gemmatimonadales bacterium]
MSTGVRPATAADAPAVLALVRALAAYERLEPPDAAAEDRFTRDGFGPSPRFEVLLGEHDAAVVGYALFFFTYSTFLARPTLFLEDLFVRPEARRHGVGGALLRALGERAVRDGCGRMEWAALTWNRLAIDFYERLGARALEEWRTFRLEGADLRRLALPQPPA